jgi:hypothetical protein
MNFENQSNDKLFKAQQKSRDFEFFSLTAQDHEDIGSTPPDELAKNFGKAQYEVMTDEKITEYLDNALSCVKDPIFIKNGYAKTQKEFFVKSLSFLKSVGRLPQKFNNFNINSLPDLE